VALLVGLRRARQPRWEAEDALEELAQLARSAGARVQGMVLQERPAPDPRTCIGRGKAEELAAGVAGVDVVIFDEELSGSQQRNLEDLLQRKVVDRTGLILDIFAQRARTREAKLQVELAQLDYMLPRLVGGWAHLERLGGGIGTRGPGETQLESDRRVIRRRLTRIRRDLERVRRHRAVLRRPRQKVPLAVVALVGYTNAGKSSLLNALTRAGVYEADHLFATLDPTIRRLQLPDGRMVLLSDTVGFIRKLPHQLVAAFKATLEEVAAADLLVHVVDVSHPAMAQQMEAVEAVLAELGLARVPRIEAYNKVDRLPAPPPWAGGEAKVALSAKSGSGLADLLKAIARALDRAMGARGPARRGMTDAP
jgi:GTP-binding protein HflX